MPKPKNNVVETSRLPLPTVQRGINIGYTVIYCSRSFSGRLGPPRAHEFQVYSRIAEILREGHISLHPWPA